MADDIRFTCQHCGQSLEAQADMAGDSIDCPTCHKLIAVPISEPTQKRPGVLSAKDNSLLGHVERLEARMELLKKEIKRLDEANEDASTDYENEEIDIDNELDDINSRLQEVISAYRDECFAGTGDGLYFGRNGMWSPDIKKPTKAQVGTAIQAISKIVGAKVMLADLRTIDFELKYADDVLSKLQELFPDLEKS
jgi:hypothetical protein